MNDIKCAFGFCDHKEELLIRKADNCVHILKKITRCWDNIPYYNYSVDGLTLECPFMDIKEFSKIEFSMEEVMDSFIKRCPIKGYDTCWEDV